MIGEVSKKWVKPLISRSPFEHTLRRGSMTVGLRVLSGMQRDQCQWQKNGKKNVLQ